MSRLFLVRIIYKITGAKHKIRCKQLKAEQSTKIHLTAFVRHFLTRGDLRMLFVCLCVCYIRRSDAGL